MLTLKWRLWRISKRAKTRERKKKYIDENLQSKHCSKQQATTSANTRV